MGGGRSSSSLDVAVLSLCLLGTQRLAPLDSPDGPGWGSPGSGNGNWLISSCATRFSTVALCFAAFVCFLYWEHVRACPAWSLRICLTSRELSAKDGEGGPLGTLADIASSVHGVLVRLGDGGALGALSDSVEPSLLEELPLVSLELYLLSHQSSWLTRSQGCSVMCHWCRPHCYGEMVQYQAHCHDPLLTALLSPALEWHRWLESSGRKEALREVVLVLVVCLVASMECILSWQQGCH